MRRFSTFGALQQDVIALIADLNKKTGISEEVFDEWFYNEGATLFLKAQSDAIPVVMNMRGEHVKQVRTVDFVRSIYGIGLTAMCPGLVELTTRHAPASDSKEIEAIFNYFKHIALSTHQEFYNIETKATNDLDAKAKRSLDEAVIFMQKEYDKYARKAPLALKLELSEHMTMVKEYIEYRKTLPDNNIVASSNFQPGSGSPTNRFGKFAVQPEVLNAGDSKVLETAVVCKP